MGMAVNCEKGLVGSVSKKVAAPTTISGAVSPTARDTDKIVPVMMPGRAAGKTCRQIVCQRVAPNPYDASRIVYGTARMASCELMMMIGNINSTSVNPAETSVRPFGEKLLIRARDAINWS